MENQAGGQAFGTGKMRGLDSFRRSARRNGRKGKGAVRAVIRGVLVGASVTIIAVAFFALILNWWNASDRAVTAINQVVKFVSILAAVSVARGEKGGAARGCLTGFLYMLLGMICYSLLLGQSPDFSAYLADLGMGLAAGGLFAMILDGSRER